LPWAYELAQKTKKAIILFPIAFHMDRAEEIWSDRHTMQEIAKFRQKNIPKIPVVLCKCCNKFSFRSASSENFWSGFQTYSDVIQVVKNIRNHQIQSISPETSIDCLAILLVRFYR
jgi:hypothetical protein